jgi:hypothetical protein
MEILRETPFYTFMSFENCIKAISSNQLLFSSPTSFNDPYDCEIIIKSYTKNLKEWIRSYNESNPQVDLQTKDNEPYSIIEETIRKHISKLGISCFSRENNNVLMWAHYANKHKGVCMQFLPSSDQSVFYLPREVKYEKKIPHHDINKIQDNSYLIDSLCIKSEDWGYENEIRFFNQKSGLQKFNKGSLLNIYFGCRLNNDEVNIIKTLASSHFGYNVKFHKAKLSQQNFEVLFDEI